MGQVFIEDLDILKCPNLETMCTQLRTLRIGSYAPERIFQEHFHDPSFLEQTSPSGIFQLPVTICDDANNT